MLQSYETPLYSSHQQNLESNETMIDKLISKPLGSQQTPKIKVYKEKQSFQQDFIKVKISWQFE